jgi:hypothetical protein
MNLLEQRQAPGMGKAKLFISSEKSIEKKKEPEDSTAVNTGRGRTAFRRALTKINDSLYLVGADTLKLQNLQSVLNVGHQKNMLYTDTAVVDTFGYTMWNGYPSNYGVSYAPYGKGMNFTQGWQRFNGVNAPLGRPNVVGIAWGYNTTPGGASWIRRNRRVLGSGPRLFITLTAAAAARRKFTGRNSMPIMARARSGPGPIISIT